MRSSSLPLLAPEAPEVFDKMMSEKNSRKNVQILHSVFFATSTPYLRQKSSCLSTAIAEFRVELELGLHG